MPLIAHAFAGLGTSLCIKPKHRASAGAGMWTSIMVALAYLPDVVSQILSSSGFGHYRNLTHSILFAVVVSVVLGPVLAYLARCSARRAMALVLFSVVVHDVLDFFYMPGLKLLWPISAWAPYDAWPLIPTGLWFEGLLSGWVFLMCLTGYLAFFRKKDLPRAAKPAATPAYVRALWVGRVLTLVVFALAGTTYHLRAVRSRQFATALDVFFSEKNVRGAQELLDKAESWPSLDSRVFMDWLQGCIHEAQGNRSLAEQAYLRSLQDDPRFFYGLAYLAVFYASSDEPLDVRRRRAAPYIHRLRKDCSTHESAPGYLRKTAELLELPIDDM